MKYYRILIGLLINCGYILAAQPAISQPQSNQPTVSPVIPQPSVFDTLNINYKLWQEMERQRTNMPEANTSSSLTDEELVEKKMVEYMASLGNSIGEPRFRDLILSIVMYGLDIPDILALPTRDIVSAFTGILKKGPMELVQDPKEGPKLNYTPLELCIKLNLNTLTSALNIRDTASEEDRFKIGSALRNTSLISQFIDYFKDAQLHDFYKTIFGSNSNLSNLFNPSAREEFAQSLATASTEEEKLNIFKSKLKPEYQDDEIAKSLLKNWEHLRKSPGKMEKTLKSVAFIMEYPDVIKAGFKGHSPLGLYIFSKSTSEKRLAQTLAAAKKYNTTQADKTKQINLEELAAIWESLDEYHSHISLGRFAVKATRFSYRAVNWFRKLTFRKARDFEKGGYTTDIQFLEDYNKSWINTVAKAGNFLLKMGTYTLTGTQATYAFAMEVKDGVTKMVGVAKDTFEGASRIVTNAKAKVVSLGTSIMDSINYFRKNNIDVEIAQPAPTPASAEYDESSISAFTKFKDSLLELVGTKIDLLSLLKEAVTSGESTDPEKVSSGFMSYATTASDETSSPEKTLPETLKFMTTLCRMCYESATADSTTSEFENQKQILVRALVLEAVSDHLKKTPQEGEAAKEDQKAYNEKLEEFITKTTATLLQDMDSKITEQAKAQGLWTRAKRRLTGGISNADYLTLLTEQLKTNRATITTQVTNDFQKFNEDQDLDLFVDAPDPADIRTLPSATSITIVASYEKEAFDKLFAKPTEGKEPTPFQKALQGCDLPTQHLLGFMIESTLLQSDSYRQELQKTGVKEFYKGLDGDGNNITRLVSGGSSCATVLKYATAHNFRQLQSFIQGARVAAVLAHDTLIQNFFDTYGNSLINDPENPSAKEDFLKEFAQSEDKTTLLKQYLSSPYDTDDNASILSQMLQNHMSLPSRVETSLFFMEHQRKIVAFLKNKKLSDEECIQKIKDATPGSNKEDIKRMLPSLRTYYRSMSFIQTRKVQLIKRLSYTLKRFFSALSSSKKVKNYSATEFQHQQDFGKSISNSWMNDLAQATDISLTEPQQTRQEDLLESIKQRQPEMTTSQSPDTTSDIQELPQQLQDYDSSITPVDAFIKVFGATPTTQESVESAQQSIQALLENKGSPQTLSLVKATMSPAMQKLDQAVLTQKVLCGLETIKLLQAHTDTLAAQSVTSTVDDFTKLTDTIYKKVNKKINSKSIFKKRISIDTFKAALESLSVADFQEILQSTLGIDSLPGVTKLPHGIPISSLPIVNPPGDSSDNPKDTGSSSTHLSSGSSGKTTPVTTVSTYKTPKKPKKEEPKKPLGDTIDELHQSLAELHKKLEENKRHMERLLPSTQGPRAEKA